MKHAQIALISLSSLVPFDRVQIIAAALQIQLDRDFTPIWGRSATVVAYARVSDPPKDSWQIVIQDDINEPGAAGFHTTYHGQPYALIQAEGEVSVTCSHELIEMMVDPYGNRMIPASMVDPANPQGERVQLLAEACDPCEEITYEINGVNVSDFLRPEYYDAEGHPDTPYTFCNSIPIPHGMLRGGYLSFVGSDGVWRQIDWFGDQIETVELGFISVKSGSTLRRQMDSFASIRKAEFLSRQASQG